MPPSQRTSPARLRSRRACPRRSRSSPIPSIGRDRRNVAPGIGATHGVRTPLQAALRRAFERASRGASNSELLVVVDRLLREPEREARWFAITTLQRTLAADPERTWQLLRRAASAADDWITVDTLAHPYGQGMLAEPYRWAELEPLTISPSRWERRLVGSTIATIPFVNPRLGREPEVAERGLALLATLIGDREPDVQKALSWAYRSMALVDLPATTVALEREAATAAKGGTGPGDGHRAWVIRDTLSKLQPADAAALRGRLTGIRRHAEQPPPRWPPSWPAASRRWASAARCPSHP